MDTTKLHNVLIDSGSERLFLNIDMNEDDNVTGRTIIQFQDQLHLEPHCGDV